MSASLTPSPVMQFFDNAGNPLSGGKLYTYAAGTSTPLATYTDQGGATPNANPVVLNTRGEANIWLGTSLYKFTLKDSTDVLIWTADNIGGVATAGSLAASSGSSLVGFIASGTGAVARTVQSKLRDILSVTDFGAKGDGTTNDTVAIQACIDAAHATFSDVYFPAGNYKLLANPLTIYSSMRLFGTGGHLGCLLRQFTANVAIFTYTYGEDIEIDHLSFFTGNVTGVFGIKQTDLTNFTSNSHIHHCHFYADLNTCVSGNFLGCEFGPKNTFGYYGTVGASHTHITSTGTVSATTNLNYIHGNRFFQSKGAGSGTTFDRGFMLVVENNDYEQNSVCPLNCFGTEINVIRGNWFEANNFTSEITMANSSGGSPQPNIINVVESNFWHPAAAVTNLIQYSGAGTVSFTNNYATTMTGKTVTNSSDGFVGNFFNNNLSGYAGSLVDQMNLGALNDSGGGLQATISPLAGIKFNGRNSAKQGAVVAAANNLVLGTDGNYFQISGSTQINRIDATSWQGGSVITLKFNATPVVKTNFGNSGVYKEIFLAGTADFSATTRDLLTLQYDITDGCWYEQSRSVN